MVERNAADAGAEADFEGVVEEALARLAILEDVGEGDVTAAVIPEDRRAVGVITAREEGIASGLGVAARVFTAVDPAIRVEMGLEPGERFERSGTLLRATGNVRGLLTAERSALNFLQLLCGIATATRRYVDAVDGTGVRISDTRKTAPGLRLLEKEAVRHGGGVNHRLGLYDAVMIKDNHVDAAGGIAEAVAAARAAHPGFPIVVEARSIPEAEIAARLDVGRILLDNMDPRGIAAGVEAIRAIECVLAPAADPGRSIGENRWIADTWRPGDGRIQIEVSGGITLDNVRDYAVPGVDFISVGALTHSVRALDLTMDLEIDASARDLPADRQVRG
jgi:nicotinate-nucleotide pyrophosphorylase (carboxylating)